MFKLKFDKSLIIFGVMVLAVLLVSGAILFLNKPADNGSGLSPEKVKEISDKTLDFINKNLLSQGTTASIVETSQEYGLIKMKLKIGTNELDSYELDSYVTQDGAVLFPEAIKLEEPSTADTPAKQTCEDITKKDKPLLEAFVVSKCPYGLQMQRILAEVVKNIPSLKNNIKVRYIGSISSGKITSMHGDAEAQENLRQICIREETDKYWDYVSCHIKKGDVDGCLSSAGIDKNKINACMQDVSKGLKYAEEDFGLATKYKASGSPTLILNETGVDEFSFGGRTAEAAKTFLCCAFTNEPTICSTELSTQSAATSFSETYSSASNDSSNGGGCQ